ncbi:MAG: lytic murein transglycosylase, partial [Rhodobacterales bacterium]|nr:lytic murein transglycosylase [Rhodobacterales bacterium]
AVVLGTLLGAPAARADQPFDAWLAGLRAEALQKGISQATVDAALGQVETVPRVLELDRYQPEFTRTFWAYLTKRITDTRIERARKLLADNRALLEKVRAKYGVQPRYLVAFWALESNFGDYTGVFPLFGALATLAHDARRADFFRGELLAALKLMDRGEVSTATKASWAGAMGQCQFIPTTYVAHAVDFDGDGKRDLWNSLPDIFASAANYLAKSGWDGNRTWGREVKLPQGFDLDLADVNRPRKLAEWQTLGVRRADGRDLPRVDVEGAVILPSGADGPAFLVYRNYHAIMAWNRAMLYAIAVGHLSDRIAGQGPLLAPRPKNEVALSRDDVMTIQKGLVAAGFDPGTPDGVIGAMTRKAVRAFQKSRNLPADGYPDKDLLDFMTAGGGKG